MATIESTEAISFSHIFKEAKKEDDWIVKQDKETSNRNIFFVFIVLNS